MSIMDSFLRLMKLNDDPEEYDDEYDDYDEEPVIEDRKSKKITKLEEYDSEERSRSKAAAAKPVSAPRNNSRKSVGADMEVCVIKPTSVDDAREVADTLRANRAVVLNVEGLDLAIAQRILDISYGACYAINGNFQEISRYIFILTPSSVDISGDFPEILGSAFNVQKFKN